VVKGKVDMSDVRREAQTLPVCHTAGCRHSFVKALKMPYVRILAPIQIDDLDFVLEKHQQDDGFAILCMSRPASDCEIEAQCDW
jgi:hypothetical protein